jgi:hypothetical protein
VYSNKSVWEARQVGLQLGLGLKNLGPFQEANISAGYSRVKLQDSYQLVSASDWSNVYYAWSINDDNIYSANVNINLKHDIDENNNIKLFAGFDVDNFGLRGVDQSSMYMTYPANRVNVRTTQAMETLGLGFNHTVNEGVGLVSAGLKVVRGTYKESAGSFMYNQDTVSEMRTYGDEDEAIEYGYEGTEVPAFVSVEAKVKSWLTLRAGAEYVVFGTMTANHKGAQSGWSESMSYAEFMDEYMDESATLSFTTGFGINWKNFVLDGVLDTNALESQIASVQPGRGLLFSGNTVTVVKADLKYKF